MVKIKGVGAIMIYANDPVTLSGWYDRVLGISTSVCEKDGNYYGEIKDVVYGRATPFGIFTTEHKLSTAHRSLMVNYEVDNFDEVVDELKGKGIDVKRTLIEDYGKFAYIDDPEGNPIEIWEGPKNG